MIVMWRRAFVEKRRIIVPLVFGIIAVVVLYVAVVFPLSHQVTSTERDERASRDELVKARQDYNNAKATVAGKKEADATLQTFYKDHLPADKSVAQRLTFTRLAEFAQQSNVKLEHGSNEVSHEKGSSLSKLNVRYTLTGDYRDFGGQGIHFSPKGLHAHGQMWADKVSVYLDRVLAATDQASGGH